MKIVSNEKWNDGTPVRWEVEVKELPINDAAFLEESYDREGMPNEERIRLGAVIRRFLVMEVLEVPDPAKSDDVEEPIAGCEFQGVQKGQELVVLMNPRELFTKQYGLPPKDFRSGPMLMNLQDCGFDVEVVE